MVKKIKHSTIPDVTIQKNNPQKIVFSFENLEDISYSNAKNDSDFFIRFIKRLKSLCSLDWDTVNRSPRHSFGWEKIKASSIKPTLPISMDSLMVFRSTGDNHVFLGYRDGNTFQVLFIEYKFGDIYDHN